MSVNPLDLFVCLGFINFHLYGDVTVSGKGLQMLTKIRHSWPLRSDDLACRTYCDTGILSNCYFRGSVTLTLRYCRAFSSVAVTICFYDLLRSVAVGIRSTNLPLAGPTLHLVGWDSFHMRGKRFHRLRSHGGGYHLPPGQTSVAALHHIHVSSVTFGMI